MTRRWINSGEAIAAAAVLLRSRVAPAAEDVLDGWLASTGDQLHHKDVTDPAGRIGINETIAVVPQGGTFVLHDPACCAPHRPPMSRIG